MQKRTVHYVLSTHWDREWYQTFQDFRYRLVRLFDRVIDGWLSGKLRGPFQTDGQAVMLEDYLEIRPERRDLVEQLVREGKFILGPFYTQPDEFIPSGEALIRNLEMGRRLTRRFGAKPANAGYLSDIFGHNSQIPQIFAGFGIPYGFLWRGIPVVETSHHFLWRGADGTEIPCYRFVHEGYCDFPVRVRRARINEPPINAQQIAERLEAYLDDEANRTEIDPILAFDGGDHMEWDQAVYPLVSARMDHPDERFTLVHSTLDEYIAEALPQSNRIAPIFEGELLAPAFMPESVDKGGFPNSCISSRLWIKQANAHCQSALTQWAEPFSAFANEIFHQGPPPGFLETAWKNLLMNHAHDSICGCSIDAVHRDMAYRFEQSRQIANRLTTEATRCIAASITGSVGDKEMRVVVFNPLPQPLSQVVDLDLEIPADWPKFLSQQDTYQAFRIFDSAGVEIPYQWLALEQNRTRYRQFDSMFPREYKVNVAKIALPLEIPALGYTTLFVKAGEEKIAVRFAPLKNLVTGERSMANEHISLTIETDGSLTLTDLNTRQRYANLLAFEDCADIGDGWTFGLAMNDRIYLSTGAHATISLVHHGSYQASFLIQTVLELPAEYDFNVRARSAATRSLEIENLVTLRRGAYRLEVKTTVQNNIKDHRLRVLFPSGAQAKTYLADTPFDVVERRIALNPQNYLSREQEVETKPQQSWTAVFDDQRGLVVIATGQHETAIQDLPARPLALTLLRGTRKTVLTDGEPDGQVLGKQKFQFWIMPLAGEPDRAALCAMGQSQLGSLRTVQQTSLDVDLYRQPYELPPAAGMLHLRGPVVLSEFRQVENGFEIRVYNPDSSQTEAGFDFSGWPANFILAAFIQPVNFEGSSVGAASRLVDGKHAFTLGPKKIGTFRLWSEKA